MKKVFIGVGHGGSDQGAVKYINEADTNLIMALACRDYLEDRGVKVKMSRTKDENDTINEEILECVAFNPDVAVDVHNNAGGGNGFEAYYHHNGGTSKKLAKNIEAEVKKIGQNSRGIKTRMNFRGTDYYGFIRCVSCPSVICEGVFVDNRADASQADTIKEQRAFGVAYAKGILKTLGIKDEKKSKSNEPYKVKVVKKTLRVRKGPGIKYKTVTKVKRGEIYTITEKVTKGKTTWGKLKSGEGYINLKYTKKL